MEIERFDIKGLALLTPDIFRDERGYFFETWSAAKYAELGIPADA